MSGPKVVRVVTREELLARSMAIAARLQEALSRWRAAAQEAAELSEDELAQTVARHEQIRSVLTAEKFAQFDQEANREIAFLASDLERRRELAANRRARRRQAQLNAGQNARTLMQALKEKRVAVDARLMQVLELASRGKAEMQDIESALAVGFGLLAPREKASSISQTQRDLAERLAAGGRNASLGQWKAAQAAKTSAVDDPRIGTVSRQLEVLRLLGADTAAVGALEKRLDECLQAPSSGQGSMKLDSLLLELTTAVRDARDLERLIDEAAGVLVELSTLHNDQAVEARSSLQAALTQRNTSAIEERMATGRAVLTAGTKAAAAHARRAAVLQGLAKLGYAVHEGMETAWVEAGRIVVQKPSLDGYGVELSGAPDAERLQVRTVALAQDRDTSRDLDAEHLWCGDFTKLKDDLALAGSRVLVDRALGVGAVPLKVAQVTGARESGRSVAGSAKTAS